MHLASISIRVALSYALDAIAPFKSFPAMSRCKTNDQVQHGQWRKDASSAKLDVTLKSVDFADSEAEAETNRMKLLQEVAIMRQFRHPNILRLYGVVNEERVSVKS